MYLFGDMNENNRARLFMQMHVARLTLYIGLCNYPLSSHDQSATLLYNYSWYCQTKCFVLQQRFLTLIRD